jgi:hypothetical protein
VTLPQVFDPLATHERTIRWSLTKIEYLVQVRRQYKAGPRALEVNRWEPKGTSSEVEWRAANDSASSPKSWARPPELSSPMLEYPLAQYASTSDAAAAM